MIASFSGKEVEEWQKALNQLIAGKIQVEESIEKESCPLCGKSALKTELLEKGCSGCGWVSPRQEMKLRIKN